MPSEMSYSVPDCAVLGLGYLGRPLAQKLYENGSQIAAVKRSLTSDDINLPIQLDCADLNQAGIFQTAFWQTWQTHSTWFWLLPPSALTDYTATLQQWLNLAERFHVRHIVFAGSISVYGDAVRECNEHTPPDPQTDSAKILLAAEHLCLDSRVPNIDIIRLGGLYSAERHPLNRLLARQNISGGNQPVNVIHQDEAVHFLFQTALNPRGKRLKNLVSASHPSRMAFYGAEAAKLGLPQPDFNPHDNHGGKIVNTVCEYGVSL